MKISCKLKDLRKEKKLTQEDLADKLGISRQSIISLESGRSIPSLSLALEIANFFDCAIEQVFECDKEINKKMRFAFGGLSPVNNWVKQFINANSHLAKSNVLRKEVKMTRDLLPWRPFGLSRFFDEEWPELEFPKSLSVTTPAINVYEKGKNIVVECQLPGIDPENVKIDVSDDLVKLSGEKKEEKEEKDKNYYRREISYGSFARSVALPKKVKSSGAEAEYSDGVLRITLPKVEEKESKTVKIKVKKKK